MQITKLQLATFRNYAQLAVQLAPGLTVLVGPNASGKSAFLEALVLLATGQSPRAGSLREVIQWNAPETPGFTPLARIAGEVQGAAGERTLLDLVVQIRPLKDATAPDHNGCRARLRVNRHAGPRAHASSYLQTVLFRPEDLDLLSGPPAGRRAYLDGMLVSDAATAESLACYKRILAGRNALLRRKQAGERVPRAEFVFWNRELGRHGATIIAARRQWLARLAPDLQAAHARFGGSSSALTLVYRSTVPEAVDPATHVQTFYEAMRGAWHDEISAGQSLVGPHRDDLALLLDGRDLAVYGSRGQQRAAILALKWAEIAWRQHEAGEAPVVLLDDVMNELDGAHRDQVAAWLLATAGQVLVTTTRLHSFPPVLLGQAQVIRVADGVWTPDPPTVEANQER